MYRNGHKRSVRVVGFVLAMAMLFGNLMPVAALGEPSMAPTEQVLVQENPEISTENTLELNPLLPEKEAVGKVSEKAPVAESTPVVLAATAQTEPYNYNQQFSTTQVNNGVWAYGYAEQGTVKLEQGIQYISGRWANDTNGIRILSDGLMPGSRSTHPDAVAQWTAPRDGVIEITAGGIARVPYKSQAAGPLNAGTISMEEYDRSSRDGVALSVLQNGTGLWPDTGAYRNLSNRKAFPFEPLRTQVKAGDTIWFRLNGNGGSDNYDNDRTFWNPCVAYVDAAATRLDNARLEANGLVKVDLVNAAALNAADVKLYAMVNDGTRTELKVLGVAVEGKTAAISFEEISTADARVQLQIVALGDNRTVTFNTKDFPADKITVTTVAGENGKVDPAGTFKMSRKATKEIRFIPNEGYEVYYVKVNGQTVEKDLIVDNTYTISNPTGDMTVEVVFKNAGGKLGTTYYVDAVNGNDENPGTSEDKAWKSLEKINATTFNPGDKILFHAGQVWNGFLWPKGEGSEADIITVSSYGGEGYPVINGNGTMPYDWTKRGTDTAYTPTVLLSDQSNWVIENLEVTANADTKYNQVGILIFTTGRTGEMSNVTVQKCYVHDVTATKSNNKITGGIIGAGSANWIDGKAPAGDYAAEVGFNGLYFLNNHVKNVAKEGIRTTGLGGPFRNQYPHVNVEINGNFIESVFGDGIVLAEVAQNGLVEGNMVKEPCHVSDANFAGAWSWYSMNSIYRYNEVFGIDYGYNDGEAFDFDIGCRNVSYLYNYSHNNVGGFLLTMRGWGLDSNVFAYNISANDGKPTQQLFHCPTDDLRIFNNTMYIGKGITTKIFDDGNVNFFKNNIVMAHGNVPKAFTSSGKMNNGVEHNIFYPASILASESDTVKKNNLTQDPMLSGPSLIADPAYSEAPKVTYENMGTLEEFVAGMRERASIFKLTEGSPAINAGTPIGSALTVDFFGNPIVGNPDIGAHEFTNDPGPKDPNVKIPESIALDQNEVHILTGDAVQLNALVGPADALDKAVMYTSSNPEVATVSNDGRVLAETAGETVITATVAANEKLTASCKVVVYKRNADILLAVKDGQSRDNGTSNGFMRNMLVKNDTPGWGSRALVGFDISSVTDEFAGAIMQLHAFSIMSDIELTLTEVNDAGWSERPQMIPWGSIDAEGFRQQKVKTVKLFEKDAGKDISIDLSDFVREKRKNGVNSFSLLLEVTSEGGSHSQATFLTREAGENVAPKLLISGDTVQKVDNLLIGTAVGKAPELPAEVEATMLDGSKKMVPVKWNKVDPANYAKPGKYTVLGTVEGLTLPVVANVTVSNDIIVKIENVTVTTPAGQAPELPEKTTVTYIDGRTAEVAVVWESVTADQYAAEGMEFEVKGAINGTKEKAVAAVTVAAAVPAKAEQLTVDGLVPFQPVLPGIAQITYTDGSVKTENVKWNDADPDALKVPGKFTVEGTSANGCKVVCEVTMHRGSGSLDPMSMESPKGVYPQLPETVKIPVDGGTIDMAVVWEPVSKEDYTTKDKYTVKGLVYGTTLEVVMNVTATKALDPASGELIAVEDAQIQVSPSSKTDGKLTYMHVKNTTYDMAYNREAVVKFNLNALGDKAHDLSELTLKLYLIKRDDNGHSGTISYLDVWATGTTWKEETASWDNVTQSGYKFKKVAENVPVSLDQKGTYIEIPVSEALNYVSNDGMIAFALDIEKNPAENPDGSNSGLMFASHEAGEEFAPRLAYNNRHVTSVEEVKVEITEGKVPQLPETVTVTWSDGVEKEVAVHWNELPASAFEKAGTVLVLGQAEGVNLQVSAVVTVIEGEGSNPEPPVDPEEKPEVKPTDKPAETQVPNPVPPLVQTGDTTSIAGWFVLVCLCAAAVAGTAGLCFKRKK